MYCTCVLSGCAQACAADSERCAGAVEEVEGSMFMHPFGHGGFDRRYTGPKVREEAMRASASDPSAGAVTQAINRCSFTLPLD